MQYDHILRNCHILRLVSRATIETAKHEKRRKYLPISHEPTVQKLVYHKHAKICKRCYIYKRDVFSKYVLVIAWCRLSYSECFTSFSYFSNNSSSNLLSKKLMYQKFNTRYVLKKSYISASKETFQLLLNILIIRSSNKIKLFLKTTLTV